MNLLLPFAVRSEDRMKKYDKYMEDATIFCLAEMDRNKGGLIRKKPPEETVFIIEVCYPLWRVPLGRISLLFDGLGLRKHTLTFDMLPDINSFMKEIQANAGRTGTYFDFLTHNINYFQSFSGKGNKVINGLMADSSFIKDFESYLSKARHIKGSISDKVVLSPFMDETNIQSSVDGFSDLKNDLQEDLKKLGKVKKMLITITDKHIKLLMKKNEKIHRESETILARFNSETLKKTERMRKMYDKKVLEISEKADRTLQKMQEKDGELKKRKAALTVYIKRCQGEISNREVQNEGADLDHWKAELQKCMEQISEIDSKLSEIETNIREITHSRNAEVSQVEAEFTARSQVLNTEIKRVEDDRDAKIALNEERLNGLRESTSTFLTNINMLSELRNSAIAELDKIGLPHVRRKKAIIYVPFFLVCYKQMFKSRYTLFTPSFAHGMRGVTKIKGVFRASKVTVILEERSRSITKFMNLFLQLIKQNPIFEEKLVRAGAKVNILGTKEKCKNIAKGLVRIRDEGWLSEDEFRSFKDQLLKV